MNELQIFNNPKFGQIRMVKIEGKPYAVGIDVARMLEYAKPSQAVIDHCKGIRKLGIPSEGGNQETNVIPEGDIYRLIVKAADQSKNPDIKAKAEEVERWIFDEVIPSIRKTGSYSMQKPATVLEALAQTVQVLQEQEQRIKQLEGTTQAIKDTIIQEPDNWREDLNRMFNKIVDRIGGQKFQEIRNESYKLLESRAHVDLQRRLMNLRTRMLDQGATKTAIEKANRMDVIEQDPKLREIYSQIIKEYYIRYVA